MRRPIFIVAPMRSGTTLLHDLLLRVIPGATNLDDTDFEDRNFWNDHGVFCGSPITGVECPHMPTGSLSSEQIESIRRYAVDRCVYSRGGMRRIVSKNPHLANKIGTLFDAFPSAVIVHIMRDQNATVCSTKNLFARLEREKSIRHYWPRVAHYPCWHAVPMEAIGEFENTRDFISSKDIRTIAESWIRIHHGIIEQVIECKKEHSYWSVNYELLLKEPADTLANLLYFIEEDSKLSKPELFKNFDLNPERQTRWKHELSSVEIARIREVNSMWR